MYPEIEEVFENNEVKLSVCRFDDPPHKSYWINAGVGMVEFTEESFDDLITLLKAYDKDRKSLRLNDPWLFYSLVITAFLLLSVLFVLL